MRAARFETMSGVPLDPVYGPEDAELPGKYPYTRGPYASMYRSRLWTMRQFAGFGTAADTNGRFKELLRAGGDGLSTAFDMPTLLGRDSDDPLAKGEVGRAGVAVGLRSTTWKPSSRGSTSAPVSTSMTINSPAAPILAMYVKVADQTGVAALGAQQHAPERHLEGIPGAEGIRLPASAVGPPGHRHHHPLRRRRAAAVAPGVRVGGTTSARPDPRRPRSWRSRWPTGSATSRHGHHLAAGLAVDAFAPRLSFFFNAHMDFFEEIAKYRAAPSHLVPLDARPLRGHEGALAPTALPYPDRRGVADGTAGPR